MERLKVKNKVVLLIVAIVVAVLAAVIILGNTANADLKEHIDLGNKYLEELQYEQALAEYEAALKIDPNNKAALDGIENVCIAYADSMLADVSQVTILDLQGLKLILERSYEVTLSKAIEQRIVKVRTIIEEAGGDETSEEPSDGEENSTPEETQNTPEESETSEELSEETSEETSEVTSEETSEEPESEDESTETADNSEDNDWKIKYYEYLLGRIFEQEDYEEVHLLEKKTDCYLFEVTYGISKITRVVVSVDKSKELGTVIEHKEETWTGSRLEMLDAPAERNLVGKVYDMKVTEQVKQEYTAYMAYLQELEQRKAVYGQYMIAYLDTNLKMMTGSQLELIEQKIYPYLDTVNIVEQRVKYQNLSGNMETYDATVKIYLDEKRAEIVLCLVTNGSWHKIETSFASEVSLEGI